MKILIIKLGALGDVVISIPIVKRILEHHHQDQIKLLTTPAFYDLFSILKGLNIIAFERKGLLNTIKTIRWIRRQRFDRIYDLQSNDRTTIYCALSGVPFRAGNHLRYPYQAHPEKKYIGQCHSFARLNQILKSVDIKPAMPSLINVIPDHTINKISAWLATHDLTEKPFAILHAGSSALHLQKRWPYFADLATVLSKKLEIIWVGGGDDVALNNALSKKTGIDATNKFNVLELIELGRHARFAVTNDSAPMHILSFSELPIFGLFGPTSPRRTHAFDQLQNVIFAKEQVPTNDADFIAQDISDISPATVLNRLRSQRLI